MEEIVNLLQTFGFPAFMCYMMFRYLEKTDDKRELQNSELLKIINKTNIILAQIATKIGIDFSLDESDVS